MQIWNHGRHLAGGHAPDSIFPYLRHLTLKHFHLVGCDGICFVYDCGDLVDIVSNTRDLS